MPQAYQHKETSVFLCNYHLIWCPKRRRKILVGTLKERLEQIIRDALSELDCKVLAMEIMPDHLHLFVSAPPQLSPTDIVARLKGRSSRLLRIEFAFLLKMPSLWTRSYFASTEGSVSSETIRMYIQNQRTRE